MYLEVVQYQWYFSVIHPVLFQSRLLWTQVFLPTLVLFSSSPACVFFFLVLGCNSGNICHPIPSTMCLDLFYRRVRGCACTGVCVGVPAWVCVCFKRNGNHIFYLNHRCKKLRQKKCSYVFLFLNPLWFYGLNCTSLFICHTKVSNIRTQLISHQEQTGAVRRWIWRFLS